MFGQHSLFQLIGGKKDTAGFYGIHPTVYHTQVGTPYLLEPGVAVLARPETNLKGLNEFLLGYDDAHGFQEYCEDTTELPPGSQLCKIAGQLCYMSFGSKRTYNDQAQKYFTRLKESGHGSVFEHANFSLLLYGVSRSVTHELVRHRAGVSVSQLSQRYVSGSMLRFVERPEYTVDAILHEQFLERIDRAAAEYAGIANRLLEMQEAGTQLLAAEARTDLRKKVQQAARSVLPNETEAPLVLTANVRAWRHIIGMRASSHAEIEIRELAMRIFLCLCLADPYLFSDFELDMLGDGTFAVTTNYPKI